eukprot:137354_1
MTSAKESSLAEKIGQLFDPTPEDVDPEDLGRDQIVVATRKDEGIYENDNGETKSTLRRDLDALDVGEAYKGQVVSRSELAESDEDFMSDDGDNLMEANTEDGPVSEGESGDQPEEGTSENDIETEEPVEVESTVKKDSIFQAGLKMQNEMLQNQLKALEEDVGDIVISKQRSREEELEKAQHVRAQCSIWDSLVDFRINLLQSMRLVNQLPQKSTRSEFCEKSAGVKRKLSEVSHETGALLDDLAVLQHGLFSNNSEIPEDLRQPKRVKRLETAMSEEEASSTSAHWERLSDVFSTFGTFRDSTIELWNRKTQLASGAVRSRKFKALDQSVLSQISSILEDEKRLVRRSQLNRSDNRAFGAPKAKPTEDSSVATDDQDYDVEIHDDSDFYQQMLKDLIRNGQRSSDKIAKNIKSTFTRKGKKKVDRRASKGRKLRYTVQDKLVNFMPPNPLPSDSTHADLFASLFRKGSAMV